MNDLVLAKSFLAEAAVTKHRIIKFGSDDDSVVHGAAATDKLIGVSDFIDVDAGERVDVHLVGPVHVEYGGVVARGDLLTSDASGRAIATTTTDNRVVGVAMQSGVLGDIGSVLLKQGIV
jgi:hypothetical protein